MPGIIHHLLFHPGVLNPFLERKKIYLVFLFVSLTLSCYSYSLPNQMTQFNHSVFFIMRFEYCNALKKKDFCLRYLISASLGSLSDIPSSIVY